MRVRSRKKGRKTLTWCNDWNSCVDNTRCFFSFSQGLIISDVVPSSRLKKKNHISKKEEYIQISFMYDSVSRSRRSSKNDPQNHSFSFSFVVNAVVKVRFLISFRFLSLSRDRNRVMFRRRAWREKNGGRGHVAGAASMQRRMMAGRQRGDMTGRWQREWRR